MIKPDGMVVKKGIKIKRERERERESDGEGERESERETERERERESDGEGEREITMRNLITETSDSKVVIQGEINIVAYTLRLLRF